MILDEDKPGVIGFAETILEVRRKDRMVCVQLNRTNGSDGTISCVVNTDNNVDSLPGKTAGVEHKDFIPIKDMLVVFKGQETEKTLEIEMPDCEVVEENMEEIDTISFAV